MKYIKIALLICILAEEIKRAGSNLERRVKRLETITDNHEIASYNLKNLTDTYIKEGFSKRS